MVEWWRGVCCRLGFHAMQPWSLPPDTQAGLLAAYWSWSGRKCIHCEYASVRVVRIERTDGGTGSLRG